MKNKTLKFIGVMVITTFILSYLSSTALVSAAEETPGLVLETSASKNMGMGILQTERPLASTLQINSNISGEFSTQDFIGDIIEGPESMSETEDSELYYPVNLRYENFWNLEYLSEFQTQYIKAQNVSDMPDQYGNYSVSLLTEQYSLSVDDSCEIFVSDLTSEILFNAKSKGIYQVWYNDIVFSSIDIVSPSNKYISYIPGVLPPVTGFGGSPSLGKYFYFAAYETGTYRIFLETSDPIIKLTADHHKPQSIKFDEAIYGGKDPSDPTFFEAVYTMDVYQVDIDDLGIVNRYLLDVDFGTPVMNYFFENSLFNYPFSMSSGFNQILPSVTTGEVYIVIENPSYFAWESPGLEAANPVKYTLKFEQTVPLPHSIGDNETINLAKSEGVTARTFEIVNTSLVSFHFEDKTSNSPEVFESSGSYIQKIDEDEVRPASMQTLISDSNGIFVSALLEPGKYMVAFQHTGTWGTEYLHFYSQKIDFETLSVENMDLYGDSKPFTTYNFTTLDFEDVILPTWESYPNTYGATYPIGFNFSIDENFWDYGYNISIQADKNPDLFDDYITPDLCFLREGATDNYIDYTDAIQSGNSQEVPVNPNGNGDALVIGSYDKFDQIIINLADPSDDDAFIWEYYETSGTDSWRSIETDNALFVDGTETTTGSLNRSGIISWDPDQFTSTWEFQTTTGNSTNLPDTDGQPYYLIRVRCVDSSAAVANITSISLRKFVKIRFDLTSQLAFNIGTSENPVYYQASEESITNRVFDYNLGETSLIDTDPIIDKNYFSDEAILYLYAQDLRLYDYNGSTDGTPHAPLEKSLTFSVCVFQPENYKQIIDYNISENIPTTHSNQLNLSTLTSDMSKTINIPDELTLYLNITPRNMYDWTQINVQFVNASVISSKLIFPAKYDFKTAGIYISSYDNGHFDLSSLPGLTGPNMNASIEFGFITDTVFLEFLIENTTSNAAILKIFGGQFDYPMLTILADSSGTNWGLIGGIGGGVVVLVGVSIIFIYKKKHPV